MPALSDTSPEAEKVLLDVFRRMPATRKWLLLGAAYHDLRLLHAAGVRRLRPAATDRQVLDDWLSLQLRSSVPRSGGDIAMNPMASNLPGLREVLRVFAERGIATALGGSMASSLQGIPRATLDADITAEPFPDRIAEIVSSFGPDWYVSQSAIDEAHRQRSSFNIINTATGFKVDVFLLKDEPFEQSAMSRREAVTLPDGPNEPLMVHAPEDTILFKLRWYRLGNETSDRQWQDVLGVLKVQSGQLNESYLDRWAADLGIADLVARARQETSS